MRKTTLFAVATAAMIAVGFGVWAIGAPSGSMGGRASLIAPPSNAHPSTGQRIDPHQIMRNAGPMPTTRVCRLGAATAMREHVLLFCLLGLVLTATILLMTAPGAVTWALAFLEAWISGLLGWVATAAVDCLSKGKSRSARQRAVLLLGREITQSCEKRIFVIAITARIPGRLLASCLFDRT